LLDTLLRGAGQGHGAIDCERREERKGVGSHLEMMPRRKRSVLYRIDRS